MKDIGKLASLDPTLSVKVLGLVNSAYYGLKKKVTDLTMAINYLGLDTIRNLVLAASMHSLVFKVKNNEIMYNNIWKYSILVAIFAEVLSKKIGQGRPEEVFTCGVMHKVGLLVELRFMESNFIKIYKIVERDRKSFIEVELEVFGTTHLDIGDKLFERWELPPLTCNIIKDIYDPDQSDKVNHIYACMMNYADYLVQKLIPFSSVDCGKKKVDRKVLDALHLSSSSESE